MTAVKRIQLGGRLGAIASQASKSIVSPVFVGLALAAGCFGLAEASVLAAVSLPSGNDVPSFSEQHHLLSISNTEALPGFKTGSNAAPLLAIRQAKPTNQSHKLRIHNLCNKTVELVIRYQDSQRHWLMQGGVRIPSKTSRYLTSSTSQPLDLSHKLLYYYATSPDSDLVWSGNGSHQYYFEEQILNMRIHYAALDVLDDYSLFILCAAETP